METERLILRRFTPDDVDLLVELDSDPDVMRYINGGRPTPREEIETDILPWFLHYYETYPGYGFWAVIEKSSGEFIGWFHFRPQPEDPSEQPELGYRLRRSAWGKGYGTEGSRALIRAGFARFGAQRVYAQATGHQHGLATGDGEGRSPLRADVPRGLAGEDPRRRARRRGVRPDARGVGGRGPPAVSGRSPGTAYYRSDGGVWQSVLHS